MGEVVSGSVLVLGSWCFIITNIHIFLSSFVFFGVGWHGGRIYRLDMNFCLITAKMLWGLMG